MSLEEIDDLFYLILGIVTVAFIGTMGALAYVLWKGSRNEDEKGWFSHGSHNLEVIWTIVPSGVLLFIALYQIDVWAIYRVRDYENRDVDPRPAHLVAEVTARQFEWRIRYPAPGTKFKTYKQVKDWLAKPHAGDVYAVNKLFVPLNRETLIYLKSGDVQHAFFVPDLRVKQDAMRGRPSMPTCEWWRPPTAISRKPSPRAPSARISTTDCSSSRSRWLPCESIPRTSRSWPTSFSSSSSASRGGRSTGSPPARRRRWWPTTGRGTSANCATCWSGPPCSVMT